MVRENLLLSLHLARYFNGNDEYFPGQFLAPHCSLKNKLCLLNTLFSFLDLFALINLFPES
jgi:hypothetical protein